MAFFKEKATIGIGRSRDLLGFGGKKHPFVLIPYKLE